jgi:predicted methyltransferase
MFAAGYLSAKPIADRIFDRVRPLPGNLVKSLEKFVTAPPETSESAQLLCDG